MALATKCPHCQTTFRVVNDQLKLRAGLVRCGHCKEIFNGIEHLLPPAPLQQKDASGSAAVSTAAPPVVSTTKHELVDVVKTMMVSAPAPSVEDQPAPPSEISSVSNHRADDDRKSEIREESVEDEYQQHDVIRHETAHPSNAQIADAVQDDVGQPLVDDAIEDLIDDLVDDTAYDAADDAVDDVTEDAFDKTRKEISQPTTSFWRKDVDDQQQAHTEDPLQRMTLMDFTRELPDQIDHYTDNTDQQNTGGASYAASVSVNPQVDDELDAAIEDLQRKPWRKTKKNRASLRDSYAEIDDDIEDDINNDEPNFVKRGRRQQRLGKKIRLFFGVASALLFVMALAQGAYIFRDQLAGIYPQTKPALIKMCEFLSCRIKLPAQISLISIESSELQTLATGTDRFVLTTLLHNKSRTAQEWPHIELTLNDNDEKPLLRRVFKPTDYINTQTDIALGLLPDNERAVKLNFALSQIKASGYRVYLFYP